MVEAWRLGRYISTERKDTDSLGSTGWTPSAWPCLPGNPTATDTSSSLTALPPHLATPPGKESPSASPAKGSSLQNRRKALIVFLALQEESLRGEGIGEVVIPVPQLHVHHYLTSVGSSATLGPLGGAVATL